MSEISDLQDRLQDALQRIDTALANRRAPPDNTSVLEATREKLEEERILTAQLQERIRALHDKEDALVRSHADEIAALRTELDDMRRSVADQSELRAELDAILADLKPQLAEGHHA